MQRDTRRAPFCSRLIVLGVVISIALPMPPAGAQQETTSQALPSDMAIALSSPDDGRIVERSVCSVHSTPYARYAAGFRASGERQIAVLDSTFEATAKPTAADSVEYREARRETIASAPLPQTLYDSTFRSGAYACERIVYLSDGLRIVGFLIRRVTVSDGGYPVLIVNRGGTREFSKFHDVTLTRWRRYLDAGYLVVASQLRGSDGGEGSEEYGGGDVRDIRNLRPLIAELENADTANVFMYGTSRGGLMAYLALSSGMQVNAAVVQAGPVDLEALERFRPGFEAAVFAGVSDYERDRASFFQTRNALSRAEQINTPILILHGTADWRVPPDASLQMAGRLQALGKRYGLVMYAGDDHALSANRADRDGQALAWFAAHRVAR